MFVGAAVWNIAGGVFLKSATGWIFSSAGLPAPDPLLYYDTWLAMILVFGFGYYLISRDMYGHRGIVLMGIVGKLAFATIFLGWYVAHPGRVPPFFLIAVAGDLYFVVRFAMFLRHAAQSGGRSAVSS
jgi:hypothetical protein